VQYTIETRPLYSDVPHGEVSSTTIEARDAGEALSSFARDRESEIVSFQSMKGRESIATVKKDDAVFLVRVYTN